MIDSTRLVSLGRERVLGIVLAGGEGTRLFPLTLDRAKPAVPFGGTYRIVDFVLSNLVNSGIHRIKVLTQYKSDSLVSHISRNWRLGILLDHYVEPVPAQQRMGKTWFRGSADALYQSFNVVADENPDYVCVFGGDHIYRMDVRQMLASHIETGADATVAAVPMPVKEAHPFGVLTVNKDGVLTRFDEKPKKPKSMHERPGWALVSMGNYIFNTKVLREVLTKDAKRRGDHDFGSSILPMLLSSAKVHVYDFLTNEIPGVAEDGRGYWKDVGTLESYHQASLDLAAVNPVLDLFNERWPIHGTIRPVVPAKFVHADPEGDRMGMATDSLVSPGCVISGGRIHRTVLFPRARINSFSHVEESVIMDRVNIGRYCRIRRTIIDKDVDVPPRTEIGYDVDADRARFHVSESGIVVIPKGFRFKTKDG